MKYIWIHNYCIVFQWASKIFQINKEEYKTKKTICFIPFHQLLWINIYFKHKFWLLYSKLGVLKEYLKARNTLWSKCYLKSLDWRQIFLFNLSWFVWMDSLVKQPEKPIMNNTKQNLRDESLLVARNPFQLKNWINSKRFLPKHVKLNVP